MSKELPLGPNKKLVWLDYDTFWTAPNDQTPGTEYLVTDNLALGNTVVMTVPLASGVGTITVSGVSGWGMRFTWVGNFYVQG